MTRAMYNAIMLIIMFGMMFGTVLLIITPERTSYGEYTNVIKYWTNNAYVQANFAPVHKNTTKSRM